MMKTVVYFALIAGLLLSSCNEQNDPFENDERLHPVSTMSSDLKPPASITKELFAKWRSPRRGTEQAERMDNPVWAWMLAENVGTYSATKHFKLGSAVDLGPGWCSQRYGQSSTFLLDGREVLIGGEHEDFYDPDFFIYNDVIVKKSDGSVEFYGYSKADFPPTDFHSATLHGDEIILIGSLGYADARDPGATQVLILDLTNYRIRRQKTFGEAPGWIHDHEAQWMVQGKSLRLKGGEIFGDDGSLLENIDDWALDTESWTWTRLTTRKWTRVEFAREDGGWINLFEMRSAQNSQESLGERKKMAKELQELFQEEGIEDQELLDELSQESVSAFTPPKNPGLLRQLYSPPIKLKTQSKEIKYNVFEIEVQGVKIRYEEKGDHLMMTIEGELASEVVEALVDDLKGKLEELLEATFKTRRYPR